jgi:hypothetical protein
MGLSKSTVPSALVLESVKTFGEQVPAHLFDSASFYCEHLTFRGPWGMQVIMKHSVPHDLGKDKALKVTQAAWQSYSERFAKYQPTCIWSSPHRAEIGFTAKGINLTGDIEVRDTSIELDLDVPFLLRPFKTMAIGVVEEEIKTWIAKSKAGEI